MDADTKNAYALPAQWQTQCYVPVLRAEGCAVHIGNRKVTSNIHLSVLEKWNETDAREYLEKRHGICAELFATIYWQSLRFGLKKLSPHRRATTVKLIHRHLPTYAKLYSQGRVTMSSRCPRCLHHDETNAHVYCCMNQEAFDQRKADWNEMWKQLRKIRTATIIEQTWRHHLGTLLAILLGDNLVDSLPVVHGDISTLLQHAIQEQTSIGWD
mmetsp:Transcript_2298/g.3493  ORF Transcript_2298/g.3493 Transcript_2298/m.3493 type:complete len:213 (-) Transcript_2298:2130-2768(-)